MKNLIPLLGYSVALLLGAFNSQAQPGTPGADSKLVPNVSGKNSSIGNIYSPNLFDGSANVSIPIYDFSNDHGSFGISFSYNTKGIKVDELSGKAGLHWDINAGGSITRVMKDLPDELDEQHTKAPGGVSPIMTAKGRLALYKMSSIPSTVQQDGESDDFIVSVGSLSFTFNLGKDGYVFTHPNRRAKIEYDGTGDHMTFKITDESGNQYFFVAGDLQKGTIINNDAPANNANQLLEYEYTSRWVIDKIIFTEGSVITYDYDRYDAPETILYLGNEWKESVVSNSLTNLNGYPTPFVRMNNGPIGLAQLSAIHYPNGITASFVFDEYNSGTEICVKPLKEVVIGSGEDNCIRYRLDKAYHIANNNPGAAVIGPYSPICDFNASYNGRMILQGIRILSCDETVSEPYYTFEYSTNRLPTRVSGSMDRFGYANEAATGVQIGSNIPKHTYNGTAYGTDRDVTTDVNVMAAANLVKVNNAYGGSVAFTYELHSGLQNIIPGLPTDTLFLGKYDDDGLRVKSITETDKFYAGNARVKTYTYSGGQRFLTGGYFHFLSNVTGGSVTGSITETDYKVVSYSISPHQFISGSNHGYSNVTVESRDGLGNLFGRTEYSFTNFKTGTDTSYLNSGTKKYFEAPYTDKQYIKDWEIGLPIQVLEYDQNNLMASRTTNTYTTVTDLTTSLLFPDNIKTMRAQKGTNLNPFTDPVVATDVYRPYTGRAQLAVTQIEKFVNGGQAINDQVSYGYDSRNNLKWTKTKNSRGQFFSTEQVYNYEVVSGAGPGGTAGIANLYNMTGNGIEKVIGMERWKLGTTGTDPYNRSLLDASITGYQYLSGRLLTKSLHALQTGSPIGYTTYTGLSAPGAVTARYNKIYTAYDGTTAVPSFQEATEVQLFDGKGNPLETKLLDLNSYKAMLWDTATGNKLADVSNAKYNEIAFTSFENKLPGSAYPAGVYTTVGRFTYEMAGINNSTGGISGRSVYQLSPSGIGTAISISGLTPNKAYIVGFWSKNGKPVFSGAGVTVTCDSLYATNGWTYYQGKFTPANTGTMSFISSSAIYMDEIRLFPADAMMQCWTYKPLCGATSSTDASGRITYYEYDKLGRAAIVRNQEGQILSRTQYTITQ
jgi:YD repeat-containing protein